MKERKRGVTVGSYDLNLMASPKEVMQFTQAAIPPENDDFFIMRLEDALPSNLRQAPPHKRACFDITLVCDCSYERSINHYTERFSGDYITFVSPYQTHSYVLPDKQPCGFSMFFSHTFASLGYQNSSFASDFPFFSFENNMVLPLRPSKRTFILSIIEKIYFSYKNWNENSDEFIKAYFKVLLLEIRKLYFEQAEIKIITDNASNMVTQFIGLLEKHCTQKMGVESYANMLNVTPRHLSDLVKKNTGKTALHHIQERLMSEAKSILLQTNWSVSEVSYQLSFKDPSHFGKSFKNYHGITPQMYRISHQLQR